MQWLRIGITTLGAVKLRQIVQRHCNIRMIGTECFFPYRQRPLVERLRIRIATLGAVKLRQIVQRKGDIGMIGTKAFSLIASERLYNGSASA